MGGFEDDPSITSISPCRKRSRNSNIPITSSRVQFHFFKEGQLMSKFFIDLWVRLITTSGHIKIMECER